jgi:hypothetical protein
MLREYASARVATQGRVVKEEATLRTLVNAELPREQISEARNGDA